MDPTELIQAGDPEQALADLQALIRKKPADSKARIFLFQLLAVLGQWDRALNQLNVLHDMDDAALAMVNTYREVLSCEVFRRDVFAGKRLPLVFGQPDEWVALMIQAFQLSTQNDNTTAAEIELRQQALELAPAISGRIDQDQAFQWIADADSRLGPILEAVINGRYYWVPFSAISRINIEEPQDLRDLVWAPAYFTWANGGETVGFIPTRYPGSELSDVAGLKMSRRTEWIDKGDNTYHGLGQRVLVTDVDDYPLLEVREIELDTVADTIDPSAPEET